MSWSFEASCNSCTQFLEWAALRHYYLEAREYRHTHSMNQWLFTRKCAGRHLPSCVITFSRFTLHGKRRTGGNFPHWGWFVR